MTTTQWVCPSRQVQKPWGSEEIFALAEGQYCGKVLRINEGHSLSLQLHEQKDETIAMHAGVVLMEIGRSPDALEQVILNVGDTVHIPPGVVHRMTAQTDALVLEASTTQLNDVVRLEDRYGRQGTSTP